MQSSQIDKIERIESFKKITTDKNSIKIILDIAKNNERFFDDICSDTGLEPEIVAEYLKGLEKGDFIMKNPGSLSKKYVLGFNGQIFAEQLKSEYFEVKKFLGDESLIRPLKI